MTSKNNEHIEPEQKQDTQPVVVENEKLNLQRQKQPEQNLMPLRQIPLKINSLKLNIKSK